MPEDSPDLDLVNPRVNYYGQNEHFARYSADQLEFEQSDDWTALGADDSSRNSKRFSHLPNIAFAYGRWRIESAPKARVPSTSTDLGRLPLTMLV